MRVLSQRRWSQPLSNVMTSSHAYEVRPRKGHRGVNLISDALPFGGCGTANLTQLLLGPMKAGDLYFLRRAFESRALGKCPALQSQIYCALTNVITPAGIELTV